VQPGRVLAGAVTALRIGVEYGGFLCLVVSARRIGQLRVGNNEVALIGMALCYYRTEILRFRELPFSDAWLDNGAVLVRRPATIGSGGGKDEEKDGIFMTVGTALSCRSVQNYGAVAAMTAFGAKPAENLTFPQKNAQSQTQQPRPLVELIRHQCLWLCGEAGLTPPDCNLNPTRGGFW
jgi:hypothetical protein